MGGERFRNTNGGFGGVYDCGSGGGIVAGIVGVEVVPFGVIEGRHFRIEGTEGMRTWRGCNSLKLRNMKVLSRRIEVFILAVQLEKMYGAVSIVYAVKNRIAFLECKSLRFPSAYPEPPRHTNHAKQCSGPQLNK